MYLRLTYCTAALCISLSQMACAQVTPEDVWQNWQRVSAAYGQALTADTVMRDGDTLIAKGVKTFMGQDGAEMRGSVDEMRFREVGDGTVEVTVSDTYKMNVTMPGDSGKKQEINATVLEPGLRIIASGSPAETLYTYDLPKMSMSLQALEDGKALADVQADATTMSGTYLVKTDGTATEVATTIAIGDLAISMTGEDETTTFNLAAGFTTPEVSLNAVFLDAATMEDFSKALREGSRFEFSFASKGGKVDLSTVDRGKAAKFKSGSAGGGLNFRLDQSGLHYRVESLGGNWTVSGDEIPFPEVVISYGEVVMDLLMPVMKSDVTDDFSYLTRIVDLNVSPEIWAIVDPTGTFPHDPVTLVLDTKGKAKLTTDILDESAMEALGEAPPGELHALTVTDLTARAIGAEVKGTSDLTFDNSDLTTFDDMPAPTGKIDLVMKGGNGVLDKLVALGLVPSEDAMGFRMMMAMLAKPGDGPDVLTSTLEFKGAEFYANGQRLK